MAVHGAWRPLTVRCFAVYAVTGASVVHTSSAAEAEVRRAPRGKDMLVEIDARSDVIGVRRSSFESHSGAPDAVLISESHGVRRHSDGEVNALDEIEHPATKPVRKVMKIVARERDDSSWFWPATAKLPLCSTSYGVEGPAYAKGRWAPRHHNLTRLVKAQSGHITGIEATPQGLSRLASLQGEYRRCEGLMPPERRCLFQPTESSHEAARVLAAMNFDWVPEGCRLDDLLTFDTLPEWLEARKTKLVFLGDSLNVDMAETLRCRLPSDKEHLITAVRSDQLGTEVVNEISAGDILVLNAAAHFRDIGPDETKKVFVRLAKRILKLPAHRQPRAVIYRTSVQGHLGCENMYSPIYGQKLQQTLDAADKLNNWRMAPAINSAIITALGDLLPASLFRVVDTGMFGFRADGHTAQLEGKATMPDCLHYCKPGPTMTSSTLLLHVLSQMETGDNGINTLEHFKRFPP